MKDSRGNELKVGDSVMLRLPDPFVYGVVTEIRDGNVITGVRRGGSEVSPGVVELLSKYAMPVDPTNRVVENLVKIYDPGQAEAAPKPPGLLALN